MRLANRRVTSRDFRRHYCKNIYRWTKGASRVQRLAHRGSRRPANRHGLTSRLLALHTSAAKLRPTAPANVGAVRAALDALSDAEAAVAKVLHIEPKVHKGVTPDDIRRQLAAYQEATGERSLKVFVLSTPDEEAASCANSSKRPA
jgi:hypothetical protein